MTEQQQNELELAAAAEKIKTAANTAFSGTYVAFLSLVSVPLH